MHIDYSAGPRVVNEGSHTVYTRPTWDADWTEQPNLACVECQWNAAPAMNTAILRWELGAVILPGDTTPTAFGPWAGRGQFVRIDWTCDDGSTLRWVGFVDASEWPTDFQGAQTLVCYGLEQALAKTPITFAMWRDVDHDSSDTPQPFVVRRCEQPLTFNGERPSGRRCEDPIADTDGVYVFASEHEANPQPWSTREIVRYLLHYHLPTDTDGVTVVPWSIDQIEQLPDWDSPVVETDLQTVWDVLLQLIHPDQQIGCTVGSDGETVTLRCFSHLRSDLTVNGRTLVANPNQHSLTFAPDALTDAQLADMGGGYDQVTVRGARAVTIRTLTNFTHLAEDWTESLQDLYDLGASAGGYATGGVDRANETDFQREQDAAARSSAHLSRVYRTFRVRADNEIGLGIAPALVKMQRSIRLLPRLPIRPDVTWGTTPDAAHYDADGYGRLPLLVWLHPAPPNRYVANTGLSQLKDFIPDELESDLTIVPTCYDDRIDLNVVGGPQHLIGNPTFDPLPHDIDAILDYRTSRITVAIENNQYVTASYPTEPPEANIVRRLLVDVGPDYRAVYVHSGTVVGVNPQTGALQTSASAGFIRDDRDELAAIARIIADRVVSTRKTVAWHSLRKISAIAVGDLITTAAGTTIDSPVTAIHIRGGVSINAPAPATVQAYEVYRGSLDVMNLVRRLGGTASEAIAAGARAKPPAPPLTRRRA